MFNTHFLVTRQDITRSSWQHLIHSVGNGVAGVQLDGGEDSLTGRGSSSKGSSISSSSNWGSWEKTSGKASISCWAESSELSRPLGSGFLSFKSSEESSLGFSNLGSVNYWGSSVVNRGNWEVVSGNSESEVIGNIVDGVDSSLIGIGVRSGDSSVGVSLLLLGRVDVLVSVSKVAEFILSLELRADWASNRGSKRSSSNSNGSSSVSGRGGSNGNRGSSVSSRGGSDGNWGSSNGWDSRDSWGISSSVLSSDNRGGSGKSRSSSNGSSSQGTSVKSSDGSSVGKLGINGGCDRGSIGSGIRSSSSISVCSGIKTCTSKVLSSNGELSLGGSSSQNGRDNSKELHGVTSLLCVAKRSPC